MGTLDAYQADFLSHIVECVAAGKTDAATDYPPGLRGRPGVTEWVGQALEAGVAPQDVLDSGLLAGIRAIGRRFSANEVFIPEVLVAARAMKAGLAVLRPRMHEGRIPVRGWFVIGTVRGDLHDIGKNLVAMILEGGGWQVEDLGVDCPPERFVEAVRRRPGCAAGLSALLTTTMLNMRDTVAAIRAENPDTCILIGGAPVTADFAAEIGASGYGRDPTEAAELLEHLVPAA